MVITNGLRYWMAMCQSERQLYGTAKIIPMLPEFTAWARSDGKSVINDCDSPEFEALWREMSAVFNYKRITSPYDSVPSHFRGET